MTAGWEQLLWVVLKVSDSLCTAYTTSLRKTSDSAWKEVTKLVRALFATPWQPAKAA
jgi:hypothetical protein